MQSMSGMSIPSSAKICRICLLNLFSLEKIARLAECLRLRFRCQRRGRGPSSSVSTYWSAAGVWAAAGAACRRPAAGAGCAEECCAWRGLRRPAGSQESRRWHRTSAPPQRCKRQDRLTGRASNPAPRVLNWPFKLELEMVFSIQFSSSWAAIV